MWDLRIAHPLGRLPKRKLLVFVTTVLVTIFAYLFVSPEISHAVSNQATWNGSSISYGGNQYEGPTNATGKEGFHLPAGTQIYSYSSSQATTGTSEKIDFIYFAPKTDLSKATSAKYVEYNYTPPSTYSSPSKTQTISIDNTTYGQGTSTCAVPGGLGWVICPVSNTLASAMDNIYNVVVGFIAVQPTPVSQQSAMYTAWNLMRQFANVGFIIAFLVIIYSQLTSTGITNYGIKKLLPRLIIAAILVNISYYVCAIAVDASNILGYSLEQLLVNLHNTVFNHGGTVASSSNATLQSSWQTITAYVLSGGTAAAVGFTVATSGSIMAALYLLLPLLIGLILTILVVLIILAARQALIVILLIVSPLAFVAYLLPGTEKWFHRWRETFTTLLIFFPAFSLIFGGAQLASAVIIQNATSILSVLLGLAVQVAPLAIAPIILRLSGGVLGQVAGMINNPRKGLADRARNWSNDRAEMHRKKALSTMPTISPFKRMARFTDSSNRSVKERTENYSAMGDNRYNASERHKANDFIRRDTAEEHETIEKKLDIAYNTHTLHNSRALEANLHLKTLTDEANLTKTQLDNAYEDFKTAITMDDLPDSMQALKNMSNPQAALNLMNQARDTSTMLAAEALRTQAAKRVQEVQISNALKDNPDTLLKIASGVDTETGKTFAEGQALSTIIENRSKGLDATVKLLNFRALGEGKTVKDYTAEKMSRLMRGDITEEPLITEAVFEQQAKEGNMVAFRNARGSEHIDQSMLSRVIARNADTFKSKGGFDLQADPGLIRRRDADGRLEDEEVWLKRATISGLGAFADIPASNIKDMKFSLVDELYKTVINPSDATHVFDEIRQGTPEGTKASGYLQTVFDNIYEALLNDDVRAQLGDRMTQLNGMYTTLQEQGFGPSPNAIAVSRLKNDGNVRSPDATPPSGNNPNDAPPTTFTANDPSQD